MDGGNATRRKIFKALFRDPTDQTQTLHLVDITAGVLSKAAPGLFWIAVLFSALLAVQRSFALEAADSARDGLRMSGLDPAGIFLGKAAAVITQTALATVFVVAIFNPFMASENTQKVYWLFQAAVTVALPGIKRSDPDYFPAIVTNATLGVGFSSRLNQEIRIKRGLSYGAGSAVQARRLPGPIKAVAQTKNESAPEVVDLMLAEFGKLREAPAPDTELVTRKAVVAGDAEIARNPRSRSARLRVCERTSAPNLPSGNLDAR